MSTSAPHTPGEFGEPPARTPAAPVRGPGYYVWKGAKSLASLQLTVALFALGILLIFFGTLAQLDNGIWTVVDKYFWSWVVDVPIDLFYKFLNVFWKEKFPDGQTWAGTFPFPAGKLIGALMLINLLAAHAIRFRLTWKRAGIFMIHGGLLLLFAGEFITREFAVEQRMRITEGSSVDYAEDMRNVELTFVDRSDPNHDKVAVIPQNLLKNTNGRISHPDLPVDVEVRKFYANSGLADAKAGGENLADRGMGKRFVATQLPEVSGIDPNQTIDLPAAYVTLYKKGTSESLGTYVTSVELNLMGGSDTVDLGDKKLDLSLRFKRYYKPFRMHLDKFSFDRYKGTSKAKEFASDVRIFDASGNLVRTQRIAMNEPLRYGGETFYQADFDKGTEKTTVLQVVKNPGWLLPYLSCAIVGFGLCLHFGIFLVPFLRRDQSVRLGNTLTPGVTEAAKPSALVRYFPWIMVGVVALYLLSVYGRMNPPKEPVDYRAAGAMVVVEGGRTKPLDSLARVNLRVVSGREEVEDKGGHKLPAIRWYFDTLASGGLDQENDAWKYKLVRIDNEQVLQALDLKPVEGLRYSVEELMGKDPKRRQTIVERGEAAEQKEANKQKLDQTEVKFKELYERVQRVNGVAMSSGPQLPPRDYPPEIAEALRAGGAFGAKSDPRPDNEKWVAVGAFRAIAMRETTVAGLRAAQKKVGPRLEKLSAEDENRLLRVLGVQPGELSPEERVRFRERFTGLLQGDPEALPPEARRMQRVAVFALLSDEEEKAVRDGIRKDYQKWLDAHPAARAWDEMIDAYRDKNASAFTKAIDNWHAAHQGAVSDKDLSRARAELTMNRFAPFYQCTGLYVLAFILSVIGFTQQAAQRPHWAAALRKSATAVLLVAFVVHMLALFARMYIMDRPMVFVTNLYGSAVFIGWGCVALCLVLERIFPLGAGNVLAAILGLATTIVAHNLAVDDTLEMVVAVLDTNFWLATHVTTITLGYTATFVAGFLGALYVLQMLGAVVRDSYENTGEPSVGELLAFGVAATGAVAIPLFLLWFLMTALDKYEVVPSFLLWTVFGVVLVGAVLYAIGLMLLRVSMEGTDAKGQPLAGRVPGLAQPLAALALTPERGKVFGQMVYGVVCFATLLSFVGTVLGGIWADQSWGRFWGWDPKENGAVLIVLWCSLILHARWAGLVKDRGVAVLAIFGTAITAWSWFGTNQLQIGLHSYGFDTRLADGCFNYWVCMLLILGLGLVPSRFWSSALRRVSATATAVPPAPHPVADVRPATLASSAPTETPAVPQPHVNGSGNGQPAGRPGNLPRRDKGKRHGKRR